MRIALVGLALGAGGCVLADPPPTLPPVQQHPPIIHNTEAVPPNDRVLTAWPAHFVVPVELYDPTKTLFYEMFVDYTPNPPSGGQVGFKAGSVTGTDGGNVVRLDVDSVAPPLAPGCHVIELVVAFSFPAIHDVTPGDGAVITWTFDPSGDPSSCASFDAGSLNDGALVDSGAD